MHQPLLVTGCVHFRNLQVATVIPGNTNMHLNLLYNPWISLQWHKHLDMFYIRPLNNFTLNFKQHISSNWRFKDIVKAQQGGLFFKQANINSRVEFKFKTRRGKIGASF